MKQLRERFDALMFKEIKIGKISMQTVQLFFIFCIFVLGLFIRFSLRRFVSGDMDGSLTEWMTIISENGGFKALSLNFGNYNCPYLYILCLISYLDTNFSFMYYIKLVSVLFDYLASIVVFLIIYELTKDVRKSTFGLAAAILAPTVFLNSAAWGQCDIIYVTFLLLSFYYLLKDKSLASLAFMGLAFSFKLQAVFFLPFLIIMWLKKKVRLLDFLMVPAMFVITAIPAMLFGKKFSDIVAIYVGQTSFYSKLTMSYPNIYSFLDNNEFTAYLGKAGTFLTMALLGCLAYYIYSQKCHITSEFMLTLILFSVSIVVYCLPYMHERYGFMLDLFAIIYGFTATHPKKIGIAIAYQMISLLAYTPYLFRSEIFSLIPVAVFYFLLICYVGKDLYLQMNLKKRQTSDALKSLTQR